MKTRADAATTTKNARRALKPQPKPYLRTIGQGIAIGYRKKAKDGIWTASLYLGNGKYREATVGTADDILDADGTTVLDFEQARKAVLAQIEAWRAETKAASNGGIQTVKTAVEAYIAVQNAREDAQDRPRRFAERLFRQHVLADPIADIGLHVLTETILLDWMGRIPGHLKATTRKRIANCLKAALNAAAKRHRATLPAEIGVIVKHGLAMEVHSEPVARDDAALPDGDIRRILAAAAEVDAEDGWEGDLRRIFAVLAATGTRFSQAIRLKVGDLQADKGRLMIPVSRKGRGGKTSSQTPVPIGDDILALLAPTARGRRPGEPLLTRWLHEQQPGGRWVRGRAACVENLSRTGASLGCDPRTGRAPEGDRHVQPPAFIDCPPIEGRAPGQARRGSARHFNGDDRAPLFIVHRVDDG